MADSVLTEHPCIPVTTDLVTAQVTEACFSPLMTYLTLDLEVNPDAMAAFIETNGDGYYDEEGRLMWPYGGTDVFEGWLYSLSLVDGQGVSCSRGSLGLTSTAMKWLNSSIPPCPRCRANCGWPLQGGAATHYRRRALTAETALWSRPRCMLLIVSHASGSFLSCASCHRLAIFP